MKIKSGKNWQKNQFLTIELDNGLFFYHKPGKKCKN
jgi:hypothetical protein